MTAPGASPIACDVRSLAPDALTVDTLARLQLFARRHGCELCVHRASRELQELLGFVGLGGVLGLEPGGQAEEREEPLGGEEERELGDPAV
jgi:hypothetical protein